MSESIGVGLKKAAIMLANELDYTVAAEKLNVTATELRKQISELEALLCFHIFEPRQREVELTDEGRFLINAFREAVEIHDSRLHDGSGETRC